MLFRSGAGIPGFVADRSSHASGSLPISAWPRLLVIIALSNLVSCYCEALKMQKFRLPLVLLLGLLLAASSRAQDTADQEIERHFQAAKTAERTHDYQKAITEYQAVIRQRPDLAEVHTNLGLVYYLQGMNDDAIAAFQRAVELRPSILGANLFLGMAYVRTNQYQKALEPLRKAINLNPREMRAYLNLGDRKSTRLNSSH